MELNKMIDWQQVETVFLDMDGTLLDLHFDNHFWLKHLPIRYAELKGKPHVEAREYLYSLYEETSGQLNWYCLDYWSKRLDIDILSLKQEVAELIRMHPHVVEFLEFAHNSHIRLVLLTNAHRKSLELKLEKTDIGRWFDRLISSHDLGIAKEEPGFWETLQETEPFLPARTMLVDDNTNVLANAKRFGLMYLIAIAQPDSRKPAKPLGEFPRITDFRELMPI